jgi:hypothetical protein
MKYFSAEARAVDGPRSAAVVSPATTSHDSRRAIRDLRKMIAVFIDSDLGREAERLE